MGRPIKPSNDANTKRKISKLIRDGVMRKPSTLNYEYLGSVLRLTLQGKKTDEKKFVLESVIINYAANTEFAKCDEQELRQMLANQILVNCKYLNEFFNYVEILPYEYPRVNFIPSSTKPYHELRQVISIKSTPISLATEKELFKETIFKEIGKNAMMLKKYASYLPKEAVDKCITELKKNQVRVKNDPMLIDHLFSVHKTYLSEIGMNVGVEV